MRGDAAALFRPRAVAEATSCAMEGRVPRRFWGPRRKKVLSQLLLQRLCCRWNGINTGTSTGFGGNMDYRCRALARRRSQLQQPQERDVPLCGMSLFGGRPSSCKVPCTLQSGVWCTLLISSGVHQASPGIRRGTRYASLCLLGTGQ